MAVHVRPRVHHLEEAVRPVKRHAAAGLPAERAGLDDFRADLLTVTAHELRTPITVIRTVAGVLLEPTCEATSDQQQSMLRLVERNAARMQRLVDELLDLARYRSATIRLQLRRFDAVELSQSIVATSGPLASRRHQEVTLHVPAGQALPVYGDRPRLEQALLNLITNAHHFAPDAGSVDVRLEGASGGLVQWFIKNDGPGIAIAEQARLFERFFVGGHSVPRSEAGLGLGLPTALSIAQAHGGTIDVSSRPGHGSTFTLSIPAAGPAAVRLSTGMPDDAPS